MQVQETIVATASAHGGGGLRGIVRISGPQTVDVITGLFTAADDGQPIDLQRVSTARRIRGELKIRPPIGGVECDLYLWPDERSYTRQPTVELHTFGASPVLQAAVETICQYGARLAQPGEFTLRAFLAGRIDLAQAEAVLGVIDAANDRELNVALTQLAGGLSQPLQQVRDTLLNLCADLEAGLDFVDEDIEFISQSQVETELERAMETVERTIHQMDQRNVGEQLPRVVLRGEPNAGKSSLWNAMSGSNEAIVTDQAGTTRDYLTARVDAEGRSFLLIDTAGVEHGHESLQQHLRSMTDSQADAAELVLFCIDGSQPLTEWERTELSFTPADRLIVITKSDQPTHSDLQLVKSGQRTSIEDAESVMALIRACSDRLEELGSEANVVASTAVRCRDSLRRVAEAVGRASELTRQQAGDEFVAAELRVALDELGQIVGAIYTDDILDRVFSRFCIGK